jgi:hypothetical protein
MSTTKTDDRGVTPWKARLVGCSLGRPKKIGHRIPATLCAAADNTLMLDTKYDPPGNPWLALMATAAIVVIACMLSGFSGKVIGGAGGAGIVAAYNLIRMRRQREIKLDLGTAASDVVIDQNHRRIAVLAPIDKKARWIVLEFTDGFSDASQAVRRLLGGKCRDGQITGVHFPFVALVLTLVLLFVGAFAFFMVKAMMVGAN